MICSTVGGSLVSSLMLFISALRLAAQSTDTPDFEPFPSRQECYNAIKPGSPPNDTAFFWTGLNRYSDQMRVKLYAHMYGLIHFESKDAWDDPGFIDSYSYGLPEDADEDEWRQAIERFGEDYSWAFSAHATGTAYLMMPYDTQPSPISNFWQVQWPALRDNARITKIVWLDYPSAEVLVESFPRPWSASRIWWKAGDLEPATWPKSHGGWSPSEVPFPKGVSAKAPAEWVRQYEEGVRVTTSRRALTSIPTPTHGRQAKPSAVSTTVSRLPPNQRPRSGPDRTYRWRFCNNCFAGFKAAASTTWSQSEV